MKIRRIANAAAAMMVALVVALAVPVSQLRTVTTINEPCCCPDPAHCHCPTHSQDPTGEPQLKSCHKVSHDVVAPQLPAFSPPAVAAAPVAARIVAIAVTSIPAPHAAPAARRPDAPS
ncbi:MAG TPA: hypothetical protein VFQ65_25310 [Kofleriaceae bacterium]|nr:hypothetical protein [Kofleriaceae bacterium]